MIVYLLAAAVALSVAFGSGWHYGGKGPTRELITLKAAIRAETIQRKKEDEAAAAKLRTVISQASAERMAEAERAALRERNFAVVVAELDALRGKCMLPGTVRRVFDDAASGGSPANLRPPEAGQTSDAQAAAPVDCVDVAIVGRDNTEAALFNAKELNRCWVYGITLWESCTARQFNYTTEAPWLIEERDHARASSRE